MNPEDKARAYKSFIDSEAGKEFVTEIDRLINSAHEHAEASPEMSRDFVQRAKGTRDVKDHINSVLNLLKRKPM